MLNLKKNGASLRMYENIRVPPPPWTTLRENTLMSEKKTRCPPWRNFLNPRILLLVIEIVQHK